MGVHLSLVYESERLVAKQFLVLLCHKSLPAVAAVLDLRPVQVDEDLWVAESRSSIAEDVATLNDHHRLLCHQVNGKLLVHLLLLVHKPHVSVVPFLPVLERKSLRASRLRLENGA